MPTYTIYNNAADEGFIESYGFSWAQARNGTFAVSHYQTWGGGVTSQQNGTYHVVHQTLLHFDTSALVGTVTGCSLNINAVGVGQGGTGDASVYAAEKSWASVSSSNYTAGADLAGLTHFKASAVDCSATGWKTFAKDAPATLPRSANYGLLLYDHDARANVEPAFEDQTSQVTFALSGYDGGSTTNDPYLSVTTLPGFTLACASGTFTVTGQSADLRADRRLEAATGSFTLTGQSVGLLAGRKLSLESGSFVSTGQDAGLRADRLLSCASGSFTLTGQDAGLFVGRRIAAKSGAFTMTWGQFGIAYWPHVRPAAVTWTTITPTRNNGWTEVSPWN